MAKYIISVYVEGMVIYYMILYNDLINILHMIPK